MKINIWSLSYRSFAAVPCLTAVCFAGLMLGSAQGQSLDDLFMAPKDAPYQTSGQASSRVANPAVNEGDASMSAGDEADLSSPSDLRLTKSRGSFEKVPAMTAMEIRQARALAQSRARMARLEAARWAGNPTLRPSWNPSPTTASRFPSRRIVSVPVFYRAR